MNCAGHSGGGDVGRGCGASRTVWMAVWGPSAPSAPQPHSPIQSGKGDPEQDHYQKTGQKIRLRKPKIVAIMLSASKFR